MKAFKAYLDDSGGDDQPAVAIAGYVGSLEAWNCFEIEWGAALDRHQIPYFHMKEICDPRSPMHKFCGKSGAPALLLLLSDLAAALAKTSSYGQFAAVGALVPRDALARFNREYGRRLEALPLALYTAIGLMQTMYPNRAIDALLDKVTKPERQIFIAEDYLATSRRPFAERNDVAIIPAKGDLSVRSVRGLQAADFFAYEAFRKFERLDPFHKYIADFGIEIKENMHFWHEYEDWLDQQQRSRPDERKSLTALSNATIARCPIWAYEVLRDEDDLRQGVWGAQLSNVAPGFR